MKKDFFILYRICFVFCFLVFLLPCIVYGSGFDMDVSFLSHMDGTDSSTAIIDSSDRHVVTANGNAQIDTAQYKFGQSSLFDGTGDYLSIPDSSDWFFEYDDFTIDFWVRFSNVSSTRCFVSHYDSGSYHWVFQYLYGGTPALQFYNYNGGSQTFYISCAWTASTNTWYHIALVRAGNTVDIYVDGVSIGSSEQSGVISNYGGSLTIGSKGSGSSYMNGWIDEFRVSRVARWLEDFTPDASPYTLVFPSPCDSPTPCPSPTPCDSPTPCPSPDFGDYGHTEETKYFFLLSLAGVLCAFIFAYGLILAYRK